MSINTSYCIAATLSFLLLGACSSGGSGGSSDNGSDKLTLPRNGTAELDGEAVVAEFATDPGGGVTVNSISGPNSSTVRLTTSNSEIVGASFAAPGASVNLSEPGGDDRVRTGAVVGFDTTDRNDGAVIVDPSRSRFEYQTFGVWLEDRRQATGTAGAGSYGVRTSNSSVPSSGSATYNGVSTGVARRADGDAYLTASRVNVRTNFRTATITRSGTSANNLRTGVEGTAPELDFSGTGNVSGNRFKANTSGTGINGSADGPFYGPSAEEVGGTFQATGSGGVAYIGSFGAD